MWELMMLLSLTKYREIGRCCHQEQKIGGTHSLLLREERSETLLNTTLVNNPPKAFCNFCACLSNSVIYSFMYSYLLYLSKLFKVKCGFDELDIFGRIGGTLAHFTYQYVQVLHLCEQSQSKTKLLFFFFTMWTLCDCWVYWKKKCKNPPWGWNHNKVYFKKTC